MPPEGGGGLFINAGGIDLVTGTLGCLGLRLRRARRGGGGGT